MFSWSKGVISVIFLMLFFYSSNSVSLHNIYVSYVIKLYYVSFNSFFTTNIVLGTKIHIICANMISIHTKKMNDKKNYTMTL